MEMLKDSLLPVKVESISVVIPLYNKAEYIAETIKSVLTQTFRNFELIIVNDGSTDSSLEVVKSFSDNRIKIINKTNGGESSARNVGIKSSISPYVALLDADDLWEPTFLYEMAGLIERYPEAALFGSGYVFIDKNGCQRNPQIGLPPNFVGYINNYFELAITNPLYSSSSSVIKKFELDTIGMFDESLSKGPDLDMWIKIALNYKVAYLNKPLSYYRLGSTKSAMGTNVERDRCLIWNLDRYSAYEQSNPSFKFFLDSWRLAHIKNYLNGNRSELDDITPLINSIDLSKFSIFWTLFKYLPTSLTLLVFKTKRLIILVLKKTKIWRKC